MSLDGVYSYTWKMCLGTFYFMSEDDKGMKEMEFINSTMGHMTNHMGNIKKSLADRRNRKWVAIIVGIVVVILLFMLVKALWNPNSKEKEKGIAYLKKLESRDMSEVEGAVKKVRKESQAEAFANGELSVWAQFSDYVVFGDSRSVGFTFYEFLDNQRVMAEAGLTIADIPKYQDQMKTLNPSYLFLCTGINDVSIGLWPTKEEYVEAYEETMQTLMKELPDTHIYINSIFPAKDPAFNKSALWLNIPDYNEAVKAWCEEKGYSYIDNTQVFEEHNDLYDTDGIHFQKDFYEYWAINMLTEVDA